MDKNIRISVVIPCYEMNGMGAKFLRRCLDSIEKQTHKPYEVVVSDNSPDDQISNLCRYYDLPIKHVTHKERGIAANTNNAIDKATGDYIKILYQDDYFSRPDSLQSIVNNITDKTVWLATGCLSLMNGTETNPHFPEYNHDIYKGNNTIGAPSVITIKNGLGIKMDENLTWLLDCDYYAQLYKKYGNPQLMYDLNVVIGLHKDQVTNTLAEEIKRQEVKYMLNKII